MRVGWGFDAHRFAEVGSVRLGGIVVDDRRGVVATSDGDVLAHAVADALLGAACLGDIGALFPSSDAAWADADSMDLLRRVVTLIAEAGYRIGSVDATVVAETVWVAPQRDAIRIALADGLGVDPAAVSVKATTTDGLGFLGRDEGIAAMALVVLE
ncbi:MAG: 2-C-methyl-D-erythritol 2,4-cyclodiphosphate synthase [Acidimicrobiia bacterium]